MAIPNKFMQKTFLVTFRLLVTFVRWLLPAYPGGCRPAEKAGKALGERGGGGGEEEGGVVSTHIHSATLPVFGRGPADF